MDLLLYIILPCLGIYIVCKFFKGHLLAVNKAAFAFMMSKIAIKYDLALRDRKKNLFAGMSEEASRLDRPLKVLEIGAGSEPNFRYYPDGSTVICIDPNPSFEAYLEENSKKHPRLNVEFVLGMAEDMSDVKNDSIDCVVCTLVLCSVQDVDLCMSEIKRVLKKGGKFYFMEHVLEEKVGWLRSVQSGIEPLWSALCDGCGFKETWFDLSRGGFSKVELDRFDAPMDYALLKMVYLIKTHLMGTATK